MTDVSGTWNESEAAMALGFGDMTLPALPPPIIASKMASFDSPARLAIESAIGATVITATSIKTPTAVRIIVAMAKASRARLSPTFFTTVSAIVFAAPDSISTPASTPAARMRSTALVMPCAPVTISVTVWTRSAPPTRPPTSAPTIMPYAGETLRNIKTIATTSAMMAPVADIETIFCFLH